MEQNGPMDMHVSCRTEAERELLEVSKELLSLSRDMAFLSNSRNGTWVR